MLLESTRTLVHPAIGSRSQASTCIQPSTNARVNIGLAIAPAQATHHLAI